ncbi:hypothetical protein LCGC14_1068750, partial [marine sediment metagenome]
RTLHDFLKTGNFCFAQTGNYHVAVTAKWFTKDKMIFSAPPFDFKNG